MSLPSPPVAPKRPRALPARLGVRDFQQRAQRELDRNEAHAGAGLPVFFHVGALAIRRSHALVRYAPCPSPGSRRTTRARGARWGARRVRSAAPRSRSAKRHPFARKLGQSSRDSYANGATSRRTEPQASLMTSVSGSVKAATIESSAFG